MELEALDEIAGPIDAQGASLVMIAPQAIEHNKAIRDEKNLSAPILSDPGNTMAARYGLRQKLPDDLKALYLQFGIDLPKYNGDASWTLPMPACLIIDQEGMVRYAAINADYTVRPEPEETLAALKAMA
jgi:peroxiredoxin